MRDGEATAGREPRRGAAGGNLTKECAVRKMKLQRTLFSFPPRRKACAGARGARSALGGPALAWLQPAVSVMPDGLVWVQPEEQEQIARMRIALQDELAAALPELRHDHQFLRFLRGHGGFEKAVEKMRLY